jgi:hypothetical protein
MTLKEEIIGLTNETVGYDINESAVITESIKNGSMSKALRKQVEKMEKAKAKADPEASREIDKAIKIYNDAADDFEEAEDAYAQGDKSAKAQYKELKKQYSEQVRKINAGAMVKGGVIAAAVAAVVAAGFIIAGKVDPSFNDKVEAIKDKITSTVGNALGIARKTPGAVGDEESRFGKMNKAEKFGWEAQKAIKGAANRQAKNAEEAMNGLPDKDEVKNDLKNFGKKAGKYIKNGLKQDYPMD